ncbi:MAG: hypothetical protein K1X28_06485 [Parachlamydiales bacterium]|nr:hypothetical protein [Parachlamydiales bacterium]
METPFKYDLHLSSLPGTNHRTMICFHGYGANFQIAADLKKLYHVETTLVSFNFPEHDLHLREYDPNQATFGTIEELMPAFYVLKKVVLEPGLQSVDLYGFSAGGGAVVNLLAVLNTETYDAKLKQIGIGSQEKQRLIAAIEKGIVILDAPLKSIEEIIDFRGSSEEFEILAQNYRNSGFRPIDSLQKLNGLSLHILLFFTKNDEVLSNRDDALYIERLKAAQPKAKVIVADGNGHSGLHQPLFDAYSLVIKKLN